MAIQKFNVVRKISLFHIIIILHSGIGGEVQKGITPVVSYGNHSIVELQAAFFFINVVHRFI